MKLYIDTSDTEKIRIGIGGKMFTTASKTERAQRLLSFIDEKLIEEGLKLDKIDEIEVATGPGSFTGLRVGVATAQALGWALGIPVNGKSMQSGSLRITY